MKLTTVAAIAAFVLGSAAASSAHAQDASACAFGPYLFSNVQPRALGMLPSVEKTVSALGLKASMNDCQVDIVCGQQGETPNMARVTCQRFSRIMQRAISLPEDAIAIQIDRNIAFGNVSVRLSN